MKASKAADTDGRTCGSMGGRLGHWRSGVVLGLGLLLAGAAAQTAAQTSDERQTADELQNRQEVVRSTGRDTTGGPPPQDISPQNGATTTTSTTRRGVAGQRGTSLDTGEGRGMGRVTPPPDAVTEFQRLVNATTGRQLNIFGASLFLGDVPSTFAPVEDTPVGPDYVIGPGDELRVQVWGQVNQEGSFVVDRTGSISLPQTGNIHVAGQRYSQLNDFLRNELGRVYRNFNLNVTMGQLRTIHVFVVGQARHPGSYTISSLSTLLNALFASGGPLPQGSLRDIQVRRGTETITHFDLYDLLLNGDKSKDVALSPGDVIFIPIAGPQVALLGSVNNPAIYELKKGSAETTIAELLELTGGRTSSAAGTQVKLERIVERSGFSLTDVDLAKTAGPGSGGTTLQGGDIVSVISIVDRFKDAVTLRGNVANPGRYVWHRGMRVSDLIPSKDALVTRNYWQKRDQLGFAAEEFQEKTDNSAAEVLQAKGTGSNATTSAAANAAANSTVNAAVTSQARSGSTRTSEGGSAVGSALAGGNALFPPATYVQLSAPDIYWSYAVIERQSATDLTTSLIPFNLGKVVLEADPNQNLELMAGDVVSVFSTADLRVATSQQTRFIRLEGEFLSAGVYSVQPGETLRQLLRRAGGLTSDAYLYASEFTRQSTKRVEQQRLNEYVDQLEAEVATDTSDIAAKAISERDTAAANAASSSAQAVIARLRRIEATGRIVLQLKPDSRSVDDVPDLALEDGDRFVVPRLPSNVSVQGQVYNANAFVFERGRKVKDYLKMAGGPSRQADPKRAFVLRADGSVYSQQYGNLNNATMFPGDTILVPTRVDRRAVLRNLVDAATVIGQFGIGAAAVNILK